MTLPEQTVREYDDCMNRRITVSIPEHLVDEAVKAAESGRASSVSAYVAEAMSEKSGRYSLDDFLDEWEAEVGALTDEEKDWADRVLGITQDTA